MNFLYAGLEITYPTLLNLCLGNLSVLKKYPLENLRANPAYRNFI